MKKKFIRFLTLVMSLCLLIPQAPWMSANAEETKTVFETLTNGSFETVENGMPTAWTASGTNGSDTVTLQDRGNALWLNKINTTSPAVYQLVSGLTGSSVSEDGTTVTQEVTYTITAKIMVTTSTAKPVFDLRGNSQTTGKAGYSYRQIPTVSFSAVPGVWQNVTVTYKAPADLTKMDFRLINQGEGVVYFDDIVMYKTDDEAKTNLIQNGNFDADLENWTYFTTGTPGTLYNTANMAAVGTNAAVFTGTTAESNVALEQTVVVTAGDTNKFSAKLLKYTDSVPYLNITYYGSDGNQTGSVQSVDCAAVTAGSWTEVSGQWVVPEGAETATITVGQQGEGVCQWDAVQMLVRSSMLENGSFETVENGMPTAWTASGTNGSDTVTLQDRGKALWLNKQGSTSPAVYQIVSGLTGSSVSEDGTTVTQEVTYTITAKIMVTTSTAKPVFDLRGNSLTTGKAGYSYRQVPTVSFSAVPGVWQNVTVTYKAPADLTKMELRLINQGEGVVYFDDIVMYKTDDEAKTNLIQNGSFDADLENWTYFATGTPGTLYNTVNMATDGTNAMLFTGTAENTSVAMEQTVAVSAGEKYTYFASAKALDGSTGTPFLTVTHYDASGNVVGEVQNGDCTQVSSSTWMNVQATYTVPENAVTAVVSVGQTGIGNCMWDHVRFEQGEFSVEQEKDPLTIANEFRQMLAAEKNSATPVYEEPWGDSDTYDQPYAGQTNLLKNGDFEQNSGSDSDELAFWTLKEEFGEYVSLAEGEGYNGSDCIKFCVPESAGQQNPFYSQWVNVVGGAEYQISYKYKIVTTADSAATAGPTVKVECWSGKDLAGATHIAGYYVHGSKANNDGQWHTKTQKVYPGSNVTDMEFLARWLAAGINIGDSTVIYIDDVEIFMTRPPKPMDLVTDAIFYYTDVAAAEGATGTITTRINTGYYPEFSNAKVDLVILDANKNQVWPAADADITHTSENGVVSVNFPLSVLTEKETRYEVVATLYDTDGTTMKQRNVQNIFVYDRPTSLAANGVFTKDNGDIFYPEYAYHVSDYPKLAAESGINLVQMGAFGSPESALKALDNAQAQGIMGFIALYNNMLPAGNDANINNTVAIIEAVKDHPALYGYGVMDEVYLHFSNPGPDMEASYRLIRSLDPKHPVMTMEAVQSFYDECEKFVDVLCIDPYATAASQHVAGSVTAALDAVNYKKPVYALLEAYRNTHGRFPTPNDLRNNIWQALIKGASAVGYYSIKDAEIDPNTGKYTIPIWDANDGGALWQAIGQFNTYEKQLAYDHFVFGKTPVYHESAQSGAPYWYSSWYDGEDMYMVVLSMLEDAQATQNVNIPLNKDGDAAFGGFSAVAVSGRIDENGVGESVHGTDNLALTLQGWEAVLYKISKTNESLCTFGEYTSNNDASCVADGTKSAVCPICGEVDTVPDEGTKLGHQFGDYVSDGNGKAVATCQRDNCTETHTIDDMPVFAQNSVSLKGNIAVNYYTIIPTSVLNDADAMIHFTMADGEVIKTNISQGVKKVRDGITYYVFTCQVAAKEMGDEIKAQIFYGNGELAAEDTYSVKKYADVVLGDDAYAAYQPLVKAMLRYGALAQKQFGYKTDALVTDVSNVNFSEITADKLKGFASSGDGTAKATFYGTSLLLRSETTLRFFFAVEDGVTLTVKNGETVLEVKKRDGYKYVDVENISAKDLDKAVTLTVSDGANTAEVTAYPLGYCYDVLAAGDTYTEPLLSLVKALYQYHVEAKRMLG